jgi:hypothetical protein
MARLTKLNKTARRLQKMGTNGDSVLAHINPQERDLLDVLSDGKMDGGGINPRTGLLSFGNTDGESGRGGGDANPGGVGGGPAGGQTGGGIGGNTADGVGGLGGGYGDNGYNGSANQKKAEEIGNYYRDNYIEGMLDSPYAPKDTWMRVIQEWAYPSVPTSRFGVPTAKDPGIMGTMVGHLAGGPMSAVMGVGQAMGRAQSPAAQAESMAHNQSLGSQNSTGQDRDSSDGLGSQRPGGSSGSTVNQGLLGDQKPGDGRSEVPAMDTDKGTLPGVGSLTKDNTNSTPNFMPTLIQNSLQDYIWRGRGGLGIGGW